MKYKSMNVVLHQKDRVDFGSLGLNDKFVLLNNQYQLIYIKIATTKIDGHKYNGLCVTHTADGEPIYIILDDDRLVYPYNYHVTDSNGLDQDIEATAAAINETVPKITTVNG